MQLLVLIAQIVIGSGLLVFTIDVIARVLRDRTYQNELKEFLIHELRENLKTVNANLINIDRHGHAYFLRREVYESILMTGNLPRFGKHVYEPLFDAYGAGEAYKLLLERGSVPGEEARNLKILKLHNQDCRLDILEVLKYLGVTLSASEQEEGLDRLTDI